MTIILRIAGGVPGKYSDFLAGPKRGRDRQPRLGLGSWCGFRSGRTQTTPTRRARERLAAEPSLARFDVALFLEVSAPQGRRFIARGVSPWGPRGWRGPS